MPENDPLDRLESYQPAHIDLTGIEERALTPEERQGLINAAREARSNMEFLVAMTNVLGVVLKTGRAAIG